jgi:hypothetical protein
LNWKSPQRKKTMIIWKMLFCDIFEISMLGWGGGAQNKYLKY